MSSDFSEQESNFCFLSLLGLQGGISEGRGMERHVIFNFCVSPERQIVLFLFTSGVKIILILKRKVV